ncbi:hypothetical protein EW146_g2270 [Bondarzewia mesenterica]|uniref:Uncharacterized protein n=1 Tax=Bondarzewia mesenterica TaxID=1095465 RepID=A0A4S4M7D6_9AGAM|nr:hypothetical protein EW146_g2270 [Bondarzewia mesenterica]
MPAQKHQLRPKKSMKDELAKERRRLDVQVEGAKRAADVRWAAQVKSAVDNVMEARYRQEQEVAQARKKVEDRTRKEASRLMEERRRLDEEVRRAERAAERVWWDKKRDVERRTEKVESWVKVEVKAEGSGSLERDDDVAERLPREPEKRQKAIKQEERKQEEKQRARTEAKQDQTACMKKAWTAYETRWQVIVASRAQSPLSFSSIAWPMCKAPEHASDITESRVRRFFLSRAHSVGVSRKDRIRAALRRWHPDKFNVVLSRVDSVDRMDVERGAVLVARLLNDMLEKEKGS